nr:classical arabinogalactan protein 7-like [Nicotiana tomentosiformis]
MAMAMARRTDYPVPTPAEDATIPPAGIPVPPLAPAPGPAPPPAQVFPARTGRGATRGGAQSSGGPSRFYTMSGRHSAEASPDVVTGHISSFPDFVEFLPSTVIVLGSVVEKVS